MTTAAPKASRLRDLKSGARDMFMLDPRIILIAEGENPRDYSLPENREHIDRLKILILQDGVQQPLWVRFDPSTGSAILEDGECRLRSVMELISEGHEIKSVPVIQKPESDEAGRLVMMLTANSGKPLSKWEDGGAFTRLHNFGFELADIAGKTGYPERYIREAMELAAAPREVKEMLSSGHVTPGIVLQTLRKKGNAAGAEELKQKVAAAAESTKPGAKKPVKVKRARIATGVKFSDADAITVRDALKWCLHWMGNDPREFSQIETAAFNRANNALKLFPVDLALPKSAADDHPELPGLGDGGDQAEPETVVVDGTKSKPAAKKTAKKAAKKTAKK